MAKHVALLSFICLLLSCCNKNSKLNYASLIKGDWQGQKTTEGFEHDQTEFLSFEDSTCRVSIREGALRYKIANDSLYIIAPDDRTGKFIIVTLTKDSLVMLSGKHQRDTIKYTRVSAKNDIHPSAIYFANPGCFDDCPIALLEIDSSRTIRYSGTTFTQAGAYKGKLSEKVYQSIINRIRNLPADLLKEHNFNPDRALLHMQVAIVHENKVAALTAYGVDGEPVELHILLEKLMHLNTEVTAQIDSFIQASYFINNPIITSMIGNWVPPPPPPPVEILRFTPRKKEH